MSPTKLYQTQKYEHYAEGFAVPRARLKKGHIGFIREVTLCDSGDYLVCKQNDTKRKWFSFTLEKIFIDSLYSGHRIPRTLEECTNEDLLHLSSSIIVINRKLPLDELKELRELELILSREIGHYRA